MRTPPIIPAEEFGKAALLFDAVGRRTQIDPFVLHGPPQALDEDVIVATPAPVHADLDPVIPQRLRELVAGELRALVGIEDTGLAEPGERLAERLDAEPRRERVRQPPGQPPSRRPVEDRVPLRTPAGANNRSCCAQSRAACIAGLRTAPPSARSSPASQHSGDGRLPGKKIALDLQLTDLPMQIVDHLLRILDRRCLVATRKQLARTLHQLLLPAADHRRMNPKFRRQPRQGLLPRKRRHRHTRLESGAVLLPLYTHVSCLFGPVSL